MTELDPERLLRTLVEHEVEFCVIGAMAAWLQGSPAVTLDLDVMPKRELDNAERLAAALNSLGASMPASKGPVELEGADFLGWQTQRFETGAGPLDVVPHAAAIGGFEDVATIELALGDLSVRVITIVLNPFRPASIPTRSREWPSRYRRPPTARSGRGPRGCPRCRGP